jgi:ribosome-associated toxin RatA of RatAB toxin-antitoxin module
MMRFFKIRTMVPDADPLAVFDVLAAFERYPAHSPAVRSVFVRADGTAGAERPMVSDWEVDFRGGILRWTEEDVIDRERLRIEYRQLSGDIDHFSGYWQVEVAEAGCVVDFGAWFDLGIPSFDDVLDPIAEEAIHENIVSILSGLFGATRTLETEGRQVEPDAVPAFPAAG